MNHFNAIPITEVLYSIYRSLLTVLDKYNLHKIHLIHFKTFKCLFVIIFFLYKFDFRIYIKTAPIQGFIVIAITAALFKWQAHLCVGTVVVAGQLHHILLHLCLHQLEGMFLDFPLFLNSLKIIIISLFIEHYKENYY